MRVIAQVVLLLNAVALPGCADGPRLAEFGHPFRNRDLEIQWQIGTNRIPAALNIYKVAGAKWTPQFLSNIVALGDFDNPTQILAKLSPALNGHDAMIMDDAPRHLRRSIVANPSRSRVYLRQEGVKALPRQISEGVPTEEEVMKSAQAILSNLGISKAELRRKPHANELFTLRDLTTHTRKNKTTGEPVKRVIARGIFLYRQVDGIGIAGHGVFGGLHVNYGNHGRIAEMEFVWRNIHSPRNLPTADTNQLAKWIRQGKATIETEEDPSAITRLTITNATVFYFGNNGSDFQSQMFPFVNLGAIAEVGGKRVNVSVNSPVIAD